MDSFFNSHARWTCAAACLLWAGFAVGEGGAAEWGSGSAVEWLDYGKLRRDVADYMELLLREEPPTLADLARFSGFDCGGESEMTFELGECFLRGWRSDSISCSEFVGSAGRCHGNDFSAKTISHSFELERVRGMLAPVPGGGHRIAAIRFPTHFPVRFNSYFIDIEVEAGANTISLYYNTDPERRFPSLIWGPPTVNGIYSGSRTKPEKVFRQEYLWEPKSSYMR